MKIKTVKDKIVVKQIKPEKKTSSGIILVCDEVELPDFREYGIVVAFGPKAYDVKIGDKITFGRYARVKTRIGKQEYLVVKESNVLWKEE